MKKIKYRNILMPISLDEASSYRSYLSIYALYEKDGVINIGIPDLGKETLSDSNMYGFKKAKYKGLFYNGGKELYYTSKTISDRPVYVVYSNEKREITSYTSINDIDVKLEDTLNGNFKINSKSKRK